MNFIKKYWQAFVVLVVGAIGYLLLDRNRNLKAALESADASKTDAVLAEQQKEVEATIARLKQQAEEKHSQRLTDEELAKELK